MEPDRRIRSGWRCVQVEVIRVSGDTQGTATLTGASLRYEPPVDGAGSETFMIRVDDGLSGWIQQPITFTVTDNPPEAKPIERTVHFRNDLLSSVGDVFWNAPNWIIYPIGTDSDKDTLHVALVSPPMHHTGAFSLAQDGKFTYNPEEDFLGTDSFTYTLTDGRYTSLPAKVTIKVVDAVPASTPASTSLRTRPGSPVSTTFLLVDNDLLDATHLGIEIAQFPFHGTLTYDLAGRKFNYQPASGFTGLDTFSYVATDGRLTSDPIRVNVMVASNTAPKVQGERFSLDTTTSYR